MTLQSPDLDPFENIWQELKVHINARQLKNIGELQMIWKEQWSQIPFDICFNLVKNYNKRLADVAKQRGFSYDPLRLLACSTNK